MSDRKMIKWQAFDSVMNSKRAVKEISKEKRKISMPVLSYDDYENIEENIMKSVNLKSLIKITYFENGEIKTIKSSITKIDPVKKRITLKCNSHIYFSQITNAILIT